MVSVLKKLRTSGSNIDNMQLCNQFLNIFICQYFLKYRHTKKVSFFGDFLKYLSLALAKNVKRRCGGAVRHCKQIFLAA